MFVCLFVSFQFIYVCLYLNNPIRLTNIQLQVLFIKLKTNKSYFKIDIFTLFSIQNLDLRRPLLIEIKMFISSRKKKFQISVIVFLIIFYV